MDAVNLQADNAATFIYTRSLAAWDSRYPLSQGAFVGYLRRSVDDSAVLYQWSIANSRLRFDEEYAVGDIQYGANPSAGDVLVLGATIVEFVAGSPAENQVQIASTLVGTMADLITFLSGSDDTEIDQCRYALNGGTDLKITYKVLGASGNNFKFSTTVAQAVASGSSLSGGGGVLKLMSPVGDVSAFSGDYVYDVRWFLNGEVVPFFGGTMTFVDGVTRNVAAGALGNIIGADTVTVLSDTATATNGNSPDSSGSLSFNQISGTLGQSQTPTLGGDIQMAAGTSTANLVNIPNDVPMAGDLLAKAITAPASPASGLARIFVSTVNKVLSLLNDAGVISVTVQPGAAAAHLWVKGINADGSLDCTQPTAADISGLGTAALLTGGAAAGDVPVLDGNAKLPESALHVPCAIIQEQAAQGVDGQTVTGAPTAVQAALNLIVSDEDSIIVGGVLTSNSFTLGAGRYKINWSVPYVNTASPGKFQSYLVNEGTGATVGFGQSVSDTTVAGMTMLSPGQTIIDVATNTVFGVHAVAAQNGNIGLSANFQTEVYSTVEVVKIA